ncbi:MAG: LysM domain-containing protein, partial [Pseudomonadota bacterium]
MRFGIPHVVMVSLLLAACAPSWQGRAPVQRGAAMHARCGGGVTVHSGDTVFGIARRCNVSVREVIEANRLAPPYIVHPGQFLRMPGGGQEHVVVRGDTLSQLARRYGVDFQTLARTNNKSSPYTIYVGERLRIPGSYGVTQAAPAPEPPRSTGPLVIAS